MNPPPPFLRHDALFLDFDGTLVAIAATPDAVRIPVALNPALGQLYALTDGALAIVTGRPVAEIEAFLDLPDGMPVAGVHGAQWRNDPPRIAWAMEVKLAEIGQRLGDRFPDRLIESKGVAIAIHYRDRPELTEAVRSYVDELCGADNELTILNGKAVTEIKPAWANKGKAVARLRETPPFAGRRPWMLGDDVTDEDAFAAVQKAGGVGVKIGPGSSMAMARMPGPEAVLAWLQATARSLALAD